LTYWVIFGSFTFIESLISVVAWFPYYFVVKSLFILYLTLPSTRGAIVVHDKLFKPLLVQRKTPATSTTTTTPVATAVLWSGSTALRVLEEQSKVAGAGAKRPLQRSRLRVRPRLFACLACLCSLRE
ncbi:hypothetical protein BJY59DRAFT_648122, partial [Rhodotorula toruloides]